MRAPGLQVKACCLAGHVPSRGGRASEICRLRLFCHPAGVENSCGAKTGGVAGARPPANLYHRSAVKLKRPVRQSTINVAVKGFKVECHFAGMFWVEAGGFQIKGGEALSLRWWSSRGMWEVEGFSPFVPLFLRGCTRPDSSH